MHDIEYDSFGPWIYEISESHPIPKEFKQCSFLLEKVLLSIKIPRQIERRNARPDMPLYDYVVTLYKKHIQILERKDQEIIENNYLYENIECLQNRQVLLNGNLRIIMSDKVYNLPYNTVSVEIIVRMIQIIRQQYNDGPILPIMEYREIKKDLINLSFYFQGIINDEKLNNPGFKIIALQNERSISSWETGFFRNLLSRIFGKKLLESLHLSNGNEIMIISRGLSLKRRGQAIYSKETFYVKINKIKDLLWINDVKNLKLIDLTIVTSNNKYTTTFDKENISKINYNQII